MASKPATPTCYYHRIHPFAFLHISEATLIEPRVFPRELEKGESDLSTLGEQTYFAYGATVYQARWLNTRVQGIKGSYRTAGNISRQKRRSELAFDGTKEERTTDTDAEENETD